VEYHLRERADDHRLLEAVVALNGIGGLLYCVDQLVADRDGPAGHIGTALGAAGVDLDLDRTRQPQRREQRLDLLQRAAHAQPRIDHGEIVVLRLTGGRIVFWRQIFDLDLRVGLKLRRLRQRRRPLKCRHLQRRQQSCRRRGDDGARLYCHRMTHSLPTRPNRQANMCVTSIN
jgi:hypothetical protein